MSDEYFTISLASIFSFYIQFKNFYFKKNINIKHFFVKKS